MKKLRIREAVFLLLICSACSGHRADVAATSPTPSLNVSTSSGVGTSAPSSSSEPREDLPSPTTSTPVESGVRGFGPYPVGQTLYSVSRQGFGEGLTSGETVDLGIETWMTEAADAGRQVVLIEGPNEGKDGPARHTLLWQSTGMFLAEVSWLRSCAYEPPLQLLPAGLEEERAFESRSDCSGTSIEVEVELSRSGDEWLVARNWKVTPPGGAPLIKVEKLYFDHPGIPPRRIVETKYGAVGAETMIWSRCAPDRC